MMGLVVSAILNIGLNYVMIFVLELEVKGAAIATVVATLAGLLIYTLHFFRRGCNFILTRFTWDWKQVKYLHVIGFQSFLSEAGMGVFFIGCNITVANYNGTEETAALGVS